MKNLLPALLILFIVQTPVHSQDDVTFFNFWTYYSDIENSLYKHFCAVAFERLAARKTEIRTLKTKADWLQRQATVRRTLAEIIGPFPEKTPLNVQITGTLQRDGYRIEKIIYE